jgi:Zn finger protein HypA/HybF involved in hydrogenase expression
MSLRLLKFRCRACGLLMTLEERPDRCFTCGSSDVVREGWRQRYADVTVDSRSKNTEKE